MLYLILIAAFWAFEKYRYIGDCIAYVYIHDYLGKGDVAFKKSLPVSF